MADDKPVPSPFQFHATSVEAFRQRLLFHLGNLHLPILQPRHPHRGDCDRECHIIERNHTIAIIEHFIKTEL